MNQLVVESMQWNTLRHIADVNPIDESDASCLEEVRRVLARHGRLERFGIALLHSHFSLDDDEILMETTDLEKREHLVRPVKRSSLEADGIAVQCTVIGFDKSSYHQICGCDPRASGHHHK